MATLFVNWSVLQTCFYYKTTGMSLSGIFRREQALTSAFPLRGQGRTERMNVDAGYGLRMGHLTLVPNPVPTSAGAGRCSVSL